MLWTISNNSRITKPREDGQGGRGNKWNYPGTRKGFSKQKRSAMAFPSNAWCVQGMVSALLWSEHGAWDGGEWQEMKLLAKTGPSHQGPCGPY